MANSDERDETTTSHEDPHAAAPPQTSAVTTPEYPERVRTLLMVGLAIVFVSAYLFALFGVVNAQPSEKLLLRLDPLIGVIFGYFFGRLPSAAIERRLSQEANRQTAIAHEWQGRAIEADHVSVATKTRLHDVRLALASESGDRSAKAIHAPNVAAALAILDKST